MEMPVQLDFFEKPKTEEELLGSKIEFLETFIRNVQRGIFARNSASLKLISDLQKKLELIENEIRSIKDDSYMKAS